MTVDILVGDNRDTLKTLPDKSVQCCITSPPYFGLRDYQTGKWEGGDENCSHSVGNQVADNKAPGAITSGVRPGVDASTCKKCGAKRVDSQIGLEKTPNEYVQELVKVFREVKRVLKDDGIVWLNIGDSYASFRDGKATPDTTRGDSTGTLVPKGSATNRMTSTFAGTSIKHKDLIGIPWMLAFALRDDGWWLRQDIIWSKGNSMPESVTDRCTKSHEYIFLLSKNSHYYFDHEAIREPTTDTEGLRNKRSVWTVNTKPFREAHFACVDSETEALTPHGWKKQHELIDGDIIASYNKDTDKIGWQPATFHRYDYDADMVFINKRDSTQLLTPNHRCLIKRRSGNISVVTADTLKPSMKIPLVAPFEIEKNQGVGRVMASLLGWYVTEGHKKSPSIIEIYQSLSANPEKVNTIRKLLTDANAEWYERISNRTWNNRPSACVTFCIKGDVAKQILLLCPDKNKMPNWEWIKWPENDIIPFIDAVIDGDGHRRKDDKRASIIQNNKEFLDIIQVMIISLGKSCKIRARLNNECSTAYITNDRWLTLRGTDGVHEPIPKKHYTGIVWCPSVESTFWLARRDGKPFITGNTFPPELIEPCVLAGSKTGDTILDPFGGAGTTGLVAKNNGRNAILCELNPEYAEIARTRIDGDPVFRDLFSN